ncbi:unnamed protein product [Cylicocyclus nassatus]|uniref:G protein-coupled receptor n=1 Tax=Cylicocyclus nassatus TaxID=53992 RepID=A0AA36GZW4_CYLNA|nr:unnamed protein product [Cylicocyclus nassatus]
MNHTPTAAPPSMTDVVETHELPTVVVTLPIHLLTSIFIAVFMISIMSTKHMQSRVQWLFGISCIFFLIASLYDVAIDVAYLVISKRPVTVQTCSVIRNFVYNPVATQTLVDACDRFALAFFNFEMSLISPFDVHHGPIVYFSLFNALLAFILYVCIWRKLQRERKSKSGLNDEKHEYDSNKMCPNRYYWDHHVIRIFFICCTLPLFLALPSLLFTIITDLELYENPVVNVICILILDLSTPITVFIYIFFIKHLRRGFVDCIFSDDIRDSHPSKHKIVSEHL